MSSPSPSPPRIFVSFAGEDDDARLELGRELMRHGIEAYDYSILHEGDQVGMPLQEQIAGQIRSADLFISLISNASTAPFKHVVHREIRTALDQTDLLKRQRLVGVVIHAESRLPEGPTLRSPTYYHRVPLRQFRQIAARYLDTPLAIESVAAPQEVTPVVCTYQPADAAPLKFPALQYGTDIFFHRDAWRDLLKACPRMLGGIIEAASRRSWLGPFATLQERAWTHVDRIGPGCFNDLGRLICERLGLAFVRPAPLDSRLPFYQKLHEELYGLPLHIRVQVLGQLDFFSANVVIGSWSEALLNTRALRSLLHRHQRDSYYAMIIEGLCLLRLGDAPAALQVFEHACSTPGADENALGGRAKALFALQRHEEALQYARQGVEHCARKGEPAPMMQVEWLTLAVESLRYGSTPGPPHGATHLREAGLALAQAETIFQRCGSTLGLEDTVKLHKLRAHTSEFLSSTAEVSRALTLLEDITRRELAHIHFPEESLRGFPASPGNLFFAILADIGLFLDEPQHIGPHITARLQITGDLEAFDLREGATVYRFQRSPRGGHVIRFLDKDIAVSMHQLRSRQEASPSQRLQWLRELQGHARLFRDVHLFRAVIREGCGLDLPFATAVVQEALTLFPEDPYLLKDGAELLWHLGQHARARQLIKQSAAATVRLLLACRPTTDWLPGDLIANYAALQNLDDLPALTDMAAQSHDAPSS